MPYTSEAQRRFFHTPTAKKKGITPKMVDEFDTASTGKVLPDRTGPPSIAGLQHAFTKKKGKP